jgi:ribosomal protein S18 acetylase RimI-like enzyme
MTRHSPLAIRHSQQQHPVQNTAINYINPFSTSNWTITMKAKDLKILRKTLAKLNKVDHDPLAELPKALFSIPSKQAGDEGLKVRFAPSSRLSPSEFESILALFMDNMGEMYKESSWGLETEEKTEELKHPNARFLLVDDASGRLAGFVHFRFDYDDCDAPSQGVLYVYEIQIGELFRRQGLGKTLMQISERIASKAQLSKVMLTVFKKNQAAMDFYKGLAYEIDESSPSKHNEPADYEILSRRV